MPTVRIIAAVIGLDSMNKLLDVLGGIVEKLASLMLSEDSARLDGMPVLGNVDMLMGMEMLVLMPVVLVMVLDQVRIMVIMVLVVMMLNLEGIVWDSKTHGGWDCAERNEGQREPHVGVSATDLQRVEIVLRGCNESEERHRERQNRSRIRTVLNNHHSSCLSYHVRESGEFKESSTYVSQATMVNSLAIGCTSILTTDE
jgi:hypothetical protein